MIIEFALYFMSQFQPIVPFWLEYPQNIPINVLRRECTRSHGAGAGAAIDRAAIRQLVPTVVTAAPAPIAMGSTRGLLPRAF